MAYGVKVKIAPEIDSDGLNKKIQAAVNSATKDHKIHIKNVDFQIKRSEIQSAVNEASKDKEIFIRNVKFRVSKSGLNGLIRDAQKSIDDHGLTIKIKQIDASQSVKQLKTQLENMLSGLSIVGLKDFLGSDVSEAALNRASEAAERYQAVVKKSTRQAVMSKALQNEFSQIQSVLNASGRASLKLKDADQMQRFAEMFREINQEIADAKLLSGQQQTDAVDALQDRVHEFHRLIDAQREVEALSKGRTAEELAYLKELSKLSSVVQTEYTNVQKNSDDASRDAEIDKLRRLSQEIEAAKKLSGDAQRLAVDTISKKVYEISRETEERKKANREAEQSIIIEQRSVALKSQISKYVQQNSAAYGKYKDELDGLLSSLSKGSALSSADLSKISTEFIKIKMHADAAGLSGQTFFDRIRMGWKNIGKEFIAARSAMMVSEALQVIVRDVRSIDDAMTELRKVTNLTADGYAAFEDKANGMATKVGATITDAISSTADFARLGYDIVDAASLAEAALVYKNVGDGITDVSDASSSLISTIKAFGEESYTAMGIVDRFNEVGNNFAISSSGIGEALKRSAASFAVAGNNLDESIGMIVAANNIIQDPQVVGTSLKTLSAYLRAAKVEAENAGLETEGMAASVSVLRDKVLALTDVDIMYNDQEYKSMFQVYKELSYVFDKMTDIDKSALIQLLGGKKNANVITSLLTNFKEAEAAAMSSADSMGSAMKENEKRMDSISGKMIELRRIIEDISRNALNSGFVKGTIDFLKFVALRIDGIVNTFGTLPSVIFAVSASMDVLGKSIIHTFDVIQKDQSPVLTLFGQELHFKDWKNQLKDISFNFVDKFKNLFHGFKQLSWDAFSKEEIQAVRDFTRSSMDASEATEFFNQTLGNSRQAVVDAATSIKSGSVSLSAFSIKAGLANLKVKSFTLALNALKTLGNAFVLNIIPMAVSFAISSVTKRIEENRMARERALETAKEEAKAAKQTTDAAQDAIIRYLELKHAMETNIITQQKFNDTSRDIVTSLADESVAVEDLTGKYGDLNQAILNISIEKLKEARLGLSNQYNTSEKDLIGSFKGSNGGRFAANTVERSGGYNISQEDYQNLLHLLWNAKFDGENLVSFPGNGANPHVNNYIFSYYEGAIKSIQDALLAYSRLHELLKVVAEAGMADTGLYSEIYTEYARIGEFVKVFNQSSSDLNQNIVDTAIAQNAYNLPKNAQDYEEWKQKVVDDAIEISASMDGAFVSIDESAEAVAESLVDATMGESGWIRKIQESSDAVDKSTRSLTSLSDAINSTAKLYKILSAAQDDVKNGGTLSMQTIKDISDALADGEKITDYLTVQDGSVRLNEQAWLDRFDTGLSGSIEGNIEILKAKIEKVRSLNSMLKEEIDRSNQSGVAGNIEDLMNQRKQIGSIDELIKSLALYEALLDMVQQHEDPLNLSNLMSETSGYTKSIKELTDSMTILKDRSLNAEEVLNLAFKYPELMNNEGFMNAESAEEQKAAIQSIIDQYESLVDSAIDSKISAIEASAAEGELSEESKVILNNLKALRDLNVGEDVFAADAAKDAVYAYETLSKSIEGISKIKSVYDSVTGGDATTVEMIQSVAGLVSDLQKNGVDEFGLSDFLHINDNGEIDITITDLDRLTKAYIDHIDGIDQLRKEFPDIDQKIISQMKAEGEAAEIAADRTEKFTEALDGVKTATSLLEGIESGDRDILDMVKSASDIAEKSGKNITDFLTVSGDTFEWNQTAVHEWAIQLVQDFLSVSDMSEEMKNTILSGVNMQLTLAGVYDRIAAAYDKFKGVSSENAVRPGAVLNYETFKSLIELDKRYIQAIEYQNGHMTLNAEKHNEITRAIMDESRAMAVSEKQAILTSKEYISLWDAMNNGTISMEESKRLLDLEVQMKGFDMLADEIDHANDAYERWLHRSPDDSSGRYNQALEAFEVISKTFDKEEKDNPYFGRIGTDEFNRAVDFVLGEHVEVNTDEFDKGMEIVKKYLTEGASGASEFYNDLVSHNILDATTGTMNSSIEEISRTLGISEEMVRTMIDRLNEYQEESSKIRVDQPVSQESESDKNIKTIIKNIEDAEKAAQQLSQNVVNSNTDIESTKSLIDQIAAGLSSIIDSVKTLSDKPLSVDEKAVEDTASSIEGALDNINTESRNFQNGLTDINSLLKVVSESVDSVRSHVLVLYSKMILISNTPLSIKTNSAKSAIGSVSSALGGLIARLQKVHSLSDIRLRFSGGGVPLPYPRPFSGRFGRSSAGGSNSSPGGRTLVGEMGTEMVVDPARNKWYTVGESGAEFVNLPKNALVFNHIQTRKIFSGDKAAGTGEAFARGRLSPIFSYIAAQDPIGVMSDIVNGSGIKPIKPSSGSHSGKGSGHSSHGSSHDSLSHALEKIKEQTEELNAQTEHLIDHQIHLYKVADHAMDYKGMEASLDEQARLYKVIMSDSQKAVQDMIAKGAKDTDKELQEMEEKYWEAYDNLYGTLDKINALYVDGLTNKIDGIQNAFNDLVNASHDFSEYGGITVDVFQSLIQHGDQYMSLLKDENGQYVINKEAIEKMIEAEKNQLAIEQTLSYINRLNTALSNKDAEATKNLVDLSNQLSDSTWDNVYAQAALLKEAGLTDEQYQQVIFNINAMKDLSQSVISDISKGVSDVGGKLDDVNQKQKEALDDILKYTQDLIRYEKEEQVKAIEKEIDDYQKIIDLKKESLNITKEEDQYNKDVSENIKNIADLQAKIDLLSLDDSREAMAERAKLMEQMQEEQEKLNALQEDHAYDAQIDALDQMAEDYEESRKPEIEAIENSISSAEKLYQAAIERIKTGWNTLYDELIAWNTEAGNSLNREITESWNQAAEAVKKYGSYLEAISKLNPEAKPGNNGSSSLIVGNVLPKYHNGGLVDDRGEINGREVLAVLEKGEVVLNQDKKNLLYKIINFKDFLAEKFGSFIGDLGGLSSRLSPVLPGFGALVSNNGSNATFSPVIQVELNHSGDLSDRDAERYGNKIAQTAMDAMYEGFVQRGIPGISNRKIK